MTDDLVKRLRGKCACNIDSTSCGSEDDCRDAIAAADRIEALERERDQGARDYCDLMERHDAHFVAWKAAEAALATMREAADMAKEAAAVAIRERDEARAALATARVALLEIEWSDDSDWQADRAAAAIALIDGGRT